MATADGNLEFTLNLGKIWDEFAKKKNNKDYISVWVDGVNSKKDGHIVLRKNHNVWNVKHVQASNNYIGAEFKAATGDTVDKGVYASIVIALDLSKASIQDGRTTNSIVTRLKYLVSKTVKNYDL